MANVLLVINSGSSSIKFSLYSFTQELNLIYHGEIDDLFKSPYLTVFDAQHTAIVKQKIVSQGYEAGLKAFFDWFEQFADSMTLKAVGHRVVHGGRDFFQPIIITDEIIKTLAHLDALAPLHQTHNLDTIKIIEKMYPQLPQVACFDTAFHRTQEKLATLFAIPRPLTEEGIIRYGFHGISYEYIASVITKHIGEIGNERVIVAHLGNGASMCAMYQRKSIATSMGFTALDGLMMGTRCGRIDPGVLLYLIQEKNYSPKQLEHMLYNESGLLGVSGISYDVRDLLADPDIHAKEAIDLFCYRAALEVGSLTAALNGCDALIFTAGIGENSPIIRKKICERLAWLGIKLNDKANEINSGIISSTDSLLVSIIPTNEEYMIAKHTLDLVH
ncbi:MAG: acetate/propionate family kinase [Legionella sp.]|jgi:acetate kinase